MPDTGNSNPRAALFPFSQTEVTLMQYNRHRDSGRGDCAIFFLGQYVPVWYPTINENLVTQPTFVQKSTK